MIYFIYMLNNRRNIMYQSPCLSLSLTLSQERDLNSRLVQRHMVKTFRETFQFMSKRLFPPRAHKIHEESNKKNQLDRVLYCAIYNVHNNIRYVHTQYKESSGSTKSPPSPEPLLLLRKRSHRRPCTAVGSVSDSSKFAHLIQFQFRCLIN